MTKTSLIEHIKEIPPDVQQEVEDFLVFLMRKRGHRTKHVLRQDWAGALRSFRKQYTSLELQKKAMEWKKYETKQVRPVFVEEENEIVVVTVYTYFF